MSVPGPRSMAEVHHKLALLNYPRSTAPSQSLLYAGLERYALLDWLFFRSVQLTLPPLSHSRLPSLSLTSAWPSLPQVAWRQVPIH
jgi:hypothetical protein